MTTIDADDWTLRAKCRGMEDALFPEGKDQKRARAVCMGCPVRAECLVEALDHRIEWGVWGGLTERERRQLLRQRPDVESWAAVLLGDRKHADDFGVHEPESHVHQVRAQANAMAGESEGRARPRGTA